MFDYKLLSALAAVVEQAGFERAAQVLGLSQSAISQRIKLLEARVGQPRRGLYRLATGGSRCRTAACC